MDDEIWRAIVECDASYDGKVYYGLLTTRIFCRPSCKSKTPRREHVRIFSSPDEAIRAGLRPCKRCRPDEQDWRPPEEELARQLARLLSERPHEPWTLNEMAARLYVSPYYLQRCFKRYMRMSPKRYLLQKRLLAARELLSQTEESVSSIAWRVGFQNAAHFSAVFRREVGCSPTEYRQRLDAKLSQGVT